MGLKQGFPFLKYPTQASKEAADTGSLFSLHLSLIVLFLIISRGGRLSIIITRALFVLLMHLLLLYAYYRGSGCPPNEPFRFRSRVIAPIHQRSSPTFRRRLPPLMMAVAMHPPFLSSSDNGILNTPSGLPYMTPAEKGGSRNAANVRTN